MVSQSQSQGFGTQRPKLGRLTRNGNFGYNVGIVDKKEQMMTQLYTDLTEQQQWQIRAYGATQAQVDECLTEYLRRKTPFTIVTDMMMSAWREANGGRSPTRCRPATA